MSSPLKAAINQIAEELARVLIHAYMEKLKLISLPETELIGVRAV